MESAGSQYCQEIPFSAKGSQCLAFRITLDDIMRQLDLLIKELVKNQVLAREVIFVYTGQY